MSIIDGDILITKTPKGSWMFEYMVNENPKNICNTATGECFSDKTEIRGIIIQAVEEFNKANPLFTIPITQEETINH